jgi:hypothetical protein
MSGGDSGRPTFTLGQIFAAPAALGVVSAIGLTTALVGDGGWDAVSWLGLGLPTAAALWYGGIRRTRG